MIATSIANVLAFDWSAISSPTEAQQQLEQLGVLVAPLRVPRYFGEGQMHLWLLAGSSEQTGERLLFEYARGSVVTEPHGYPQNGRAYGQRVWVLAGELQFFCSGSSEPVRIVRVGDRCDHPGGIWHRSFVREQALVLIHQPHGSQLHPALRVLSARSP